MVYRKAPSPRELSAKPTEGVKEYFACADSWFAKFMTDEELVTVIRRKSPLAHISLFRREQGKN